MTMYKVIVSCVLLLQMIFQDSVKTYPFKCPHASHWRLRAKGINCSTDKYMCLYDRQNKSDTELCGTQEAYLKGNRLILSGILDAEVCPVRFYQPFNFWTNGSSSNCVYRKSICNEEGQATVSNGTESEDVACGCNSSAKFQFLSFKQESCIPSKEDCTCYYNGTNYEIPFVATDENKSFVTETLDSDSNRHLKVRMRIDAKIGATCLIFAFVLIVVIFICMIQNELGCETVTFGSIKDVVRTQLRCHQNKEYKMDPTTENTIEIESEGESNTDAKILIEADVENLIAPVTAIQKTCSGPETESHLPSVPTLEKDDSMDATNEPGAETSNTSISETLETETDGESTTEKENGKEMYTAFKSPEQTDNDIQLNLVKTKTNNPVSCTESHTDCADGGTKTAMNIEDDCSQAEGGRKTTLRLEDDSSQVKDLRPDGTKSEVKSRFQRMHKNRRKAWEEKDSLFYDTSISKRIWDEIEKTSSESVMIVGPENSGKSAMAAHIGFEFEWKGFKLFFFSCPEEIRENLEVDCSQVFVINKPLGNHNVDNDVQEWEKLSKQICETFENGNTKFIITLRTRLYKMYEFTFSETMFGNKRKVFDLSDNPLVEEERLQILERHIRKSQGTVKINEDLKRKVVCEERVQRFYLWCKLISSPHCNDIVNEMTMETDLRDLYRKGIQALQKNHKHQFCCLVLTVMYDGAFDINRLSDCIEEPDDKVIAILKSCDIENNRENIKSAQLCCDELVGTYFKQYPTESEYNILDEMISRAVLGVYGPKNLGIILKHSSSMFINKYVGCGTKSHLINVSSMYKEKFVERLFRDLNSGHMHDVFTNPSFKDHDFQTSFCEAFKNYSPNDLSRIMITKPVNTKYSSTSDSDDLDDSPFHWLCKLGFTQAVEAVLKICHKDLSVPGRVTPLHFAARYGHLRIVKMLIKDLKVDIQGCHPTGGEQWKTTPKEYAEKYGHSDVVEYLQEVSKKKTWDD